MALERCYKHPNGPWQREGSPPLPWTMELPPLAPLGWRRHGGGRGWLWPTQARTRCRAGSRARQGLLRFWGSPVIRQATTWGSGEMTEVLSPLPAACGWEWEAPITLSAGRRGWALPTPASSTGQWPWLGWLPYLAIVPRASARGPACCLVPIRQQGPRGGTCWAFRRLYIAGQLVRSRPWPGGHCWPCH